MGRGDLEARVRAYARAEAVAPPDIEGPAFAKQDMDDNLRKRILAVNVLLESPEGIPDGLEAELYAYRDSLEAEALCA